LIWCEPPCQLSFSANASITQALDWRQPFVLQAACLCVLTRHCTAISRLACSIGSVTDFPGNVSDHKRYKQVTLSYSCRMGLFVWHTYC
jgi:hypothetical protein